MLDFLTNWHKSDLSCSQLCCCWVARETWAEFQFSAAACSPMLSCFAEWRPFQFSIAALKFLLLSQVGLKQLHKITAWCRSNSNPSIDLSAVIKYFLHINQSYCRNRKWGIGVYIVAPSGSKLQKIHLSLAALRSSLASLASQLLSVVMYRALWRRQLRPTRDL